MYVEGMSHSSHPPNHPRVAAVILAAGASSRMGEHKLLKTLGPTTIVRRVAERVLATGFDAVYVVLGRDAEALKAELQDLGLHFIHNPNYAQAMGTSLRAAVEAIPEEVEAAMFILADQPFLSTEMYQQLLQAYRGSQTQNAGREARDKPLLVISQYGSVKAPPHMFRRELFTQLGLPGTEGAREVVKKYADQALVVALPEVGLTDIDAPADYQKALELVAKGY